MGVYLNPGNKAYQELLDSPIVVDKSLLIEKVANRMNTTGKYLCISRPRRFGKSTDANMLTAFFSRGCDSHTQFDTLRISGWEQYPAHLNRHNVIHLNMQKFLSAAKDMDNMLCRLNQRIIRELQKDYPEECGDTDLSSVLEEIFAYAGASFVFIVDEWDCVFREYKTDKETQKKYLDFLRLLFKDQSYVELVYMTGILPIKKYGSHSALNMFDEISMLDAKDYSEFMGFTDHEVQGLCGIYDVDYAKMADWYDGYHMRGGISTYSPRSVTASIHYGDFSGYWSQTETYEALQAYIDLNFDGLKDAVIEMLAGNSVRVNTLSFQNDMTTFQSRDDVLTLLVHLGYLGFLEDSSQVYIPNNEVKDIFVTSIQTSDWSYITKVFRNSSELLFATWNRQADRVADYIEGSHYETSILQYNDENALAYTVSLAYITAKEYYTIVRELPAGKGFADLAFIPKGDKPAMIVELKYDRSADSGISQIRNKKYYLGLENYLDNLLLVAINYDKETKKHTCVIEKY